MTLKNTWVTGEVYDATAINAVATAVNASSASLSVLSSGSASAYVATTEAINSATYADLATTTDTVTVTINASGLALVIFSAFVTAGATGATGWMSFAASGANTIAADDSLAFAAHAPQTANLIDGKSMVVPLLGLSPGSTTFKAKYRRDAAAASFQYRRITVIPFP